MLEQVLSQLDFFLDVIEVAHVHFFVVDEEVDEEVLWTFP